MYEPPVEVLTKQISSQVVEKMDDYILECVHEVGVKVNKDELIKAMQYDRDQYDKGYQDGYEKARAIFDLSYSFAKS